MSTRSPLPQLIVYGGTFDPPHQGHVDVVSLVAERFPKAKILIVPADSPPAASHESVHGQAKVVMSSFAKRFGMCEIAFRDVVAQSGGRVELSPMERDLDKPNYSVQTLEHLQKQHPEVSLGFAMGTDQYKYFHKWRRFTDVLQMATVIVARRRGTSGLVIHPENPAVEAVTDKCMVMLDANLSPAASTDLRALRAEKKAPPAGWVDGVVWDLFCRDSGV